MASKKLFLLSVCSVLMIAIGGYIYFLQKSKAPVLKQQTIVKRKIEKKVIAPPPQKPVEQPESSKESILKKEEEEKTNLYRPPQIKVVEKEKKKISKPSWTEEFFVTYFFIEDVCKFILSSYYPAHTLKNPSDVDLLKLDFKVINARYGLELLGFRIQISDIKKARKEILSRLMKPEVLEAIYERYGDLFVKELYELAKEEKRIFVEGEYKEKRALDNHQIKQLFNLLADYCLQISRILSVLANNPDVFSITHTFIEAQKKAIHYNFVLNQIMNKYKLLQQIQQNQTDNHSEFGELELKKQKAIEKYKSAIQQREGARKQILLKIKTEAKNITIEDHEILYIVEWFYRRFSKNPDIKVLFTASDILEDLAAKLKEKAKEISG